MEWAHLTSVASKSEADLLAGRLQTEGIKARVVRSEKAPGGWLTTIGNPTGPIDVHVPRDALDEGRKVLASSSSSARQHSDHRYHRTTQMVGRALIAVAIIGIIVKFLFDILM